jgi:hypothetical protein
MVPYHHFAACPSAVQRNVQKPDELHSPVDNLPSASHLHFRLFTALPQAIAPIVCVDVFYFSVSVVCVDGRKAQRNKICRAEVDWVISQTGQPEGRPDRKEN